MTSLPTRLPWDLDQEGLWVPLHPLLLRSALFLAGWGPAQPFRGWTGGLLDIAGLLLTPASFTGGQTDRLILPVCGSGSQEPGGCALSWPWGGYKAPCSVHVTSRHSRTLEPGSGGSPDAQGGPGACCPSGKRGGLGPQVAMAGGRGRQDGEALWPHRWGQEMPNSEFLEWKKPRTGRSSKHTAWSGLPQGSLAVCSHVRQPSRSRSPVWP